MAYISFRDIAAATKEGKTEWKVKIQKEGKKNVIIFNCFILYQTADEEWAGEDMIHMNRCTQQS